MLINQKLLCIATESVSLSHPSIPGGDFMFCTGWYAAAARAAARTRFSRDNFWTTFRISFIFGMIVGPDLKIT